MAVIKAYVFVCDDNICFDESKEFDVPASSSFLLNIFYFSNGFDNFNAGR